MYPSGTWRGFWQNASWGRQPMEDFELYFAAGAVTGGGTDVVGPFTFGGTYDERTGAVHLVKQYVGKHKVLYEGDPDGEGCIGGKWTLVNRILGIKWLTTGPFLLRPVLARPTGDEPIRAI